MFRTAVQTFRRMQRTQSGSSRAVSSSRPSGQNRARREDRDVPCRSAKTLVKYQRYGTGGERMEQYRVVDTPQGPQTYLLVKKRVKNLNLRLDRRGQILLSVPFSCPEERADALILEKWEWIN